MIAELSRRFRAENVKILGLDLAAIQAVREEGARVFGGCPIELACLKWAHRPGVGACAAHPLGSTELDIRRLELLTVLQIMRESGHGSLTV